MWTVGGIGIGASNEESRLFGRKSLGKPIKHFLMVQDTGTTRNSEVKVTELNHLNKKMRTLEKGQRPATSGKETLNQSSQMGRL